MNDNIEKDSASQVLLLDRRNRKKKRVTMKDVSMLYGQRPNVPDLWFLSPYEFVSEWEPILASYPTSLRSMGSAEHHAFLTDAGIEKLKAKKGGEEVELVAGEDYRVKQDGGQKLVRVS